MMIQVKQLIGYAPLAEELVMEVRVSVGISPEADAEMLSEVGLTNSPLAFMSVAYGIFCAKAYSDPIYPMEWAVCEMIPATPGLPFAACPIGKLTDFPVPYVSFQCVLTLLR